MRILTFTTLFPSYGSPLHGLFVKARMEAVAEYCQVEVVAPIPWFSSLRPSRSYGPSSEVRYKEWIGKLQVYHPPFFFIPKIGKGLDGWGLFLSAYAACKKLQRYFPFDLLDVHYAYPDGYAGYLMSRAFNKPYTVTIRGSDINVLAQDPLRRRLIYKALSRANRVIAVSRSLKEATVRLGVPEENITVIPNGVDLATFFPMDRRVARKTLHLPTDKKILLSVGRLTELKGFHLLIEAMGSLVKRFGEDLLLVIVGGEAERGNFRAYLEKRITEQGLERYVLLAGSRPPHELRVWYNAADLFCLVSSREGCPNVCLEALACGVPVVATRVGGIPEIICAPDYGLLIPEREVEAIAAGIGQGLKTKWDTEKIVLYARQQSWARKAKKVVEVFEAICRKPLKRTEQVSYF
ncbi:MAG TPA: glycosyltransferase family 4 protein [Candidatus Limnocylindrales bacterium]|nr:glycosyltransferase family 4 protein [Candidatus Limnocylindrales bacterium]